MANTITVSAQLGFSPNANVGYAVAPYIDQYIDVGDFSDSSNIGTDITMQAFSEYDYPSLRISEANVGYAVAPYIDQYIDVGDFSDSSNIGTDITMQSFSSVTVPSTVLTYESIPVVTYVVTDGSPIILVSVYNTQYWSTS
jgi:hypothetical protein